MTSRDAVENSAGESEAPGASPAPGRSKRRLWLLRGLAIAVGLLSIAGCEGALRLLGVGDPLRLVMEAPANPQALAYQLNPAIDRVYFGRSDLLGPEPRRFDLPKPRGVYRIVFLGASTVHGFPYTTEIAFPRQVEALLERQLPEMDVEALNAAVTAINSFEIADLARHCPEAQPDLVVIHAGHNEFFGPGGPGSTALPVSPGMVKLAFALRRTRLAQGIAALLPAPAARTEHPQTALPRLTEIRLGDPVFQQAEANCRSNLEAAIGHLTAHEIPVVVSTVACNLRDQGPIRTVWPQEVSEADQRRGITWIEEGARLLSEGRAEDALELLQKAEALSAEVASLQFRKGQALEALRRFDEARVAYQLARDYDGCRFRAPTSFGEIAREAAETFEERGVTLLDIEAAVAAASPHGIPGRELFLEHVHYNLAGHRLLARAFARHILTSVRKQAWQDDSDLTDAELDAAIALLPEDELVGLTFALESVQASPMAEAVGNDALQNLLLSEMERDYAELPQSRQQAFADLSLHQMQHDLASSLASVHLGRGDDATAREMAEAAVRRRPWSPEAWRLAGQMRFRQGEAAAAARSAEQALKLRPGWPEAESLRKAASP